MGESPFFRMGGNKCLVSYLPRNKLVLCFFSVTLQGFCFNSWHQERYRFFTYCEPGLRQEPNSIVNANAHISDI